GDQNGHTLVGVIVDVPVPQLVLNGETHGASCKCGCTTVLCHGETSSLLGCVGWEHWHIITPQLLSRTCQHEGQAPEQHLSELSAVALKLCWSAPVPELLSSSE